MKLMSKLFRKNNKGLSLVELICAIAILGLSTTAIGGAMVMSARHYQKDSAEFSIQQEAQLVTNQVGNLVVDAAEADWDNTSKKLTVQSDNTKHVIYQDGDKLKYEQYNNSNVLLSEGVLAEGVATNGFSVDDSAFDSNKNVSISLALDKDGTQIKADYNATSRNGKLASYENAQQVVYISAEDVNVVEPMMDDNIIGSKTYKTKIDVIGMDWDDVNGLAIDTSYGTIPPGFSVKIDTEGSDHYLYVSTGPNVSGSFPILLKTGANKADGTTPMAEKVVTIKVRRINNLIIDNPSGTNITLGNSGTEFVLYAYASGENETKGYGMKYDDDPFPYVNPLYVDFEVDCPVDCDVVELGDVDSPSVKIKLNENMSDGQQIKVTAYSKHAYQGVNKSNTPYDTSDNVVEQYIIECDRPAGPNPPLPKFEGEGILRGKDYNWQCTVANVNDFKQDLEETYGSGVTFNWYVRFSEKGQNNWNAYHVTYESGDNQKIDGDAETRYMLPDKAYDIQFFILYTKGNKIVFPHDNSLLADGNGFKEAGFEKGWDDANATATTFEQYGKGTVLEAVDLYYYNNTDQSDDFNNIGVDDQLSQVGDDGSGAIKFSLSSLASNNSERRIYYDIRHLYKDAYGIEPVIWKKIDDDNWEKLTVDSNQYVYFNGEKCFKYQLDKNGGNLGFWYVYDQNESEDVTNNKKGTYRLGFTLTGIYTTYQETKATNKNMNDNTDLTWDLFDETGTDGFYYFEITN